MIPVGEVMSTDLITVGPTVRLRRVGAIMAAQRVHAVVVAQPLARAADHRGGWKVVSDLDLLRHRGELDATAGSIARTAPIVVGEGESVARCAALLADHGTAHLLVAGFDGDPVGIASSLDLLQAMTAAPLTR